MNTRTQERVERWESRSFSGGYEGLRDLADSDFTGAVEAAGAWLFMLNGRVVGVHEGSIEDFEGASGTAHVAPDPALPLLFTMWERGGETQGKYYTEDTAISEVDDTLTSGSFTGYLELSENVLSGDYYVVYYGGRSMSAAFVGNKEELIGGDEAFRRADDEVGIYEVIDVDVDVVDIPEPAGAGDVAASGGPDDDPETPGVGGPTSAPGGVSPGDDAQSTDADPAAGQIDPEPSVGGQADPDPSAADQIDPDPSPDERSDPADGRGDEGATASESDAAAADRIAGYEDVEFDDGPADPDGVIEEEGGIPDDVVDDEIPDELIDDADPRSSPGPDSAPPGATDPADSVESGQSDPVEAPPADSAEPEPAVDERTQSPAGAGDREASTRTDAAPTGAVDPDATESAPAGGSDPDAAAEPAGATAGDAGAEDDAADRFDGEVDWRNANTIPSLDPDHSATPEPDDGGTSASGAGASTAAATGSATRASGAGRSGRGSRGDAAGGRTTDDARRSGRDDRQSPGAQPTATADSGPSQDDLDERDERIETLESAVQRVREERDQLRNERDRLDEENDSLRDEIAQLEGEIERLESEVQQLKGALDEAGVTAHDAATQLGPREAIAATNLFVRYRSKGDATLESAHAGDADADAVNGNIRLERHTQFDADDAAVNGEPYEDYLASTLEYRFVTWIVETLLYEIRDTGHAGGLKDLYDAIPEIDRAELGGDVDIVYEEDGERITEQAAFDVVLRDRMGNPLIVADLNDSRNAATESMLVELESAASRIKQANEELSAAFLVTSSFFEPGALEAVAEATSGSLLSRDSRESFVKLSRKQGYHLCLVEARADDFHINVPEL